jgi:hypothetical protein
MGFIEKSKTEGAKAAFLGDYDWKALCSCRWPYCKKDKTPSDPPPFYAHDESLSFVISSMIGLQHALCMSTNIITPALLVSNVVMGYFPETFDASLGEEQAANREEILDTAQYLVSASLIVSGFGTMMQVSYDSWTPISCYYVSHPLTLIIPAMFTVTVGESVQNSFHRHPDRDRHS